MKNIMLFQKYEQLVLTNSSLQTLYNLLCNQIAHQFFVKLPKKIASVLGHSVHGSPAQSATARHRPGLLEPTFPDFACRCDVAVNFRPSVNFFATTPNTPGGPRPPGKPPPVRTCPYAPRRPEVRRKRSGATCPSVRPLGGELSLNNHALCFF